MQQILLRRLLSFEGLTYTLLFLFPIAGMLVRGWLTNIYNVLFLVGLFYLRKRSQPLFREERVFLITCTVYVGIYFLSGLANGWGPIQTHDLGTELRFWMVIPIYLLVREQADSWRWLLYGSLVATVFIFGQAIYEVHWLDKGTAWGVYSKNLLGPFAALSGFWILSLWRQHSHPVFRTVIIIAFIMAILATAMSGSRGGYIGLMMMVFGWFFIYMRTQRVFTVLLSMMLLLGTVYLTSSIVRDGINRAMDGFSIYLNDPDIAHSTRPMGSTELHLEMWRATRYYFSDHPVLGVGPGNYAATAKKYAEEGKINPQMAPFSHPHNIFLEALCSKGLIGLAALLLLLYYPFFIMVKSRHVSRDSAGLGMLHIIGITGFSLFDASPILYNNYASILLLGIAVFFSHHLNQVKAQITANA